MSEMERLEERLRAFAAAPAEGADWEDVLRRAGERLTAHRFTRQRLATLLAAALVLAALVVGLLVPFGSRPAPRGVTSAGGPPGVNGGSGATGASGSTGALGPTDLHGPTGRIGVTGYVGPTGYTGPKAGPLWKFLAVPLTLSEVKQQSKLMSQSIYWAGARPQEMPYFMRSRGHFMVAYVRPDDLIDPLSHRLVVATYHLRGAFADLKRQAAAKAIAGPGGSIIYVNPYDPKSVLIAFPGADYQVEIHHPNAAVALATAKSGDIRPVGPGSHVPGGDHWLPGAGEITIAELRAVAPYVPLPDSKLANDGNAGRVQIDSSAGDLESQEVSASVEYPASGIRLSWTEGRTGYAETQIIDGFPAVFIPSSRRARYKVLVLQVLPTMSVWLGGPVSKSDLISVAKTLSAGPESPDAVLPPADLWPPPGAPPDGGYQLHAFNTGVLLHAVSADSVDAAAGSLAFQPVAPPALGHPNGVVYTDPTSARPSDRVLSLRYGDPMRRFWLLERPRLSTTTWLLGEAVSECSHVKHHRTCVGSASMLDLGGGVQALVVNLRGWGKQIVWVEGGVYFKVIGSVNTFSDADALSVARRVAAAAASG